MEHQMKPFLLLAGVLLSLVCCQAAGTNLIANGSFERVRGEPKTPEDWQAAGNAAVKQRLLSDAGRNGRPCAKLECTAFTGDGPDYHVMLCQVGKVALRRGQWYRLGFWAKAEGIQGGAVDVAISNTRVWANAGLSDVFTPDGEWRAFELVFRAKEDLPAEASRLQIWYKGTGILWMADLVLEETEGGVQWFPQIATEGVRNFVPNSSFECGTANWGSYTYGLSGWAGNLYRLEGVLDSGTAHHGGHSLKISLSPQTLPVFYFDYYDPIRQPVRRVLAANRGWFKVTPGEALTLSAWLKADAEGVAARLAVIEAPDRPEQKQVEVGKEWQRHAFAFKPKQAFVFIAVGLDLEASRKESATLWVDAVQLEGGVQATAYEPRGPVEAFLETSVAGNIFTNVAAGMGVALRAYNDAETAQKVVGNVRATDFFDRPVADLKVVAALPAHASTNLNFANVAAGKAGYFNTVWSMGTNSQTLRCAVIEPAGPGLKDSPLGFNHAYPWDFLVESARQAGVLWWRDWSAKWAMVEPERGRFEFKAADEQIRRVQQLDSEVEVLLPFPSAKWSTTARPEEVAKAAGDSSYLRERLPVAYAPKDLADFGRYAVQVARRYATGSNRPVTHIQVLNEPVYTDYALPRQFGYTLDDYLRLLEVAYGALKAVLPDCQVVGGISAGVESGFTRDLVTKGGLRSLDVLDLHMYDPARPAESYEKSFASLEALMRANGGVKPVWITEWGCYADDDPACVPLSVGDETMNRCRWPSERSATEHIVKFTAVTFAHGVRKIFFHAGTAGMINGPDAGGVLFEYGGTPRRMYAGVAVLNRLLGVPEESVRRVEQDGVRAYVFRTGGRFVAVAWSSAAERVLKGPLGKVRVFDLMGNPVEDSAVRLGSSPVYLVAEEAEAIAQAVSQ
jgi:hypothetical protein